MWSSLIATHKVAITITVVTLLGVIFGFQPVTHNLIATDEMCIYCHKWSGPGEYSLDYGHTTYKPHGVDKLEDQPQAYCADCHMEKDTLSSVYFYTHFLSMTDLFGNGRDREAERAGDWIPPGKARADRVLAKLIELDSATCRSCHIESEIEPQRARGRKAHEDAQETGETCVSCHNNIFHRKFPATEEVDEEEEEELDEFEDEEDL